MRASELNEGDFFETIGGRIGMVKETYADCIYGLMRSQDEHTERVRIELDAEVFRLRVMRE